MRQSTWTNLTACILLTATASAASAQSGVLLGLETDQGYRTLWIASQGDSVAVLASGEHLLVPRADGFWRVGVIHQNDVTDHLAYSPVSQWSHLVDSLQALGEPAVEDPPSLEEDCRGSDRLSIAFLGPNHVSVDRSAWIGELCTMTGRASGGVSHVHHALDDATTPLRQLMPAVALGEGLAAAPDSAYRAALLSRPDATEEERERFRMCRDDSADWYLRRGRGRWEIAIEVAPPAPDDWAWDICTGTVFALETPLPSEIVGHDELFPGLEAASRVIPNVRDAVSSPRRDLLVAVTTDSLYAARIEDGRIRPSALALPMGGRIVMAQWALGRHVARWTREVGPLLGQYPPTETVAPAQSYLPVTARVLSLDEDGSRRETGNTVLVGRPTVVGFDRRWADSTIALEDVRIDGIPHPPIPDTARGGIRMENLLIPRFVAAAPGRYPLTARMGPEDAAERIPFEYEIIAIGHAERNRTAVIGEPPEVRSSIPDETTGVPVGYLPQLDFSEPVRNVAGRVDLRWGPGRAVPVRLAAVGIDASGNPIVYPNLEAVGRDVLVHSVTLIPTVPFDFGRRYSISFRSGIIDADTTPGGSPDPQPLVDDSRTFDFETFRPHVLTEEPPLPGVDIATRGTAAYLAVEGAGGEDSIIVIRTGFPSDLQVVDNRSLRVGGRLRGLSIANRETTTPRVVAGVQRPDGGAQLVLVQQSDPWQVAGLVELPSGTRIADVATLGLNAYIATERGAIHVVGLAGARRETGRPPAEGTVAGTIAPPSATARFSRITAADMVLDGVPRPMLIVAGTSPVLTIADPTTYETLATVDTVPNLERAHAVAVGTVSGRQLAVVAGTHAGSDRGHVVVIDVTDPRVPRAVAWTDIGGTPRDVLLGESRALVSTDTRTTILRLDDLPRLEAAGGVAGLGGRLAWANGGSAIVATSGSVEPVGVRTAALRATLRVSFSESGDTVHYRITDPPAGGQAVLVLQENTGPVATIPLIEVGPGVHSVPLPPDVTFAARRRSTVDVTVVLPDGSETIVWTLDRLRLENGERRAVDRPTAPTVWDLHEPPPPPPPPVARLDSIAPLHVPQGTPVTVTLYGANLDSIWVYGWGPAADGRGRAETWLLGPYALAPGVNGTTITLPETLVANPGIHYFRTEQYGSGVPFLVTDPDLPGLGGASAVRDLSLVWAFDDGPRPQGYYLEDRASAAPGNRFVLGRDSTPGFVIPGLYEDPSLPVRGAEPDDFFLAALATNRQALSPAIPMSSIPMDTLFPQDVRLPIGPTTMLQEDCFNLELVIEDLAASPVLVHGVSPAGPRQVEVGGFGLTEDMEVVFRVRSWDRPEVFEARSRLTGVVSVPHPVDPRRCGIRQRVPERQRARAIFTMDPPTALFRRVYWFAGSGAR